MGFWLQTDTYQGFLRRYNKLTLTKGFQRYMAAKLAIKKANYDGFEATFFAILYGVSLLFGRPGFESRHGQFCGTCIFVAP